jgi:acetoin utilization protein AcuB
MKMSLPVSELMTKTPKTIGHDISVAKAKQFMQELGCHHLPVLDGGRLVGVLSDRDIALVERTPGGENTSVEELMGDDPLVISPETDLKSAVQTMLENKVHSLVVSAKGDQPWGILTATDALRFFVAQ